MKNSIKLQEKTGRVIPTINFHFIEECNYRCVFCYANYPANRKKEILSDDEKMALIEQIGKDGRFRKINFAGGEPFLYERLLDLVRCAKQHGLETSIVTNFSLLTQETLSKYVGYLDILGLSIDSLDPEILIKHGRYEGGIPDDLQDNILAIAEFCHQNGIMVKVNTVVTQANRYEILARFVNQLRAFRWKILQVNIVPGLVPKKAYPLRVPEEEFYAYVEANRPYIDSSKTEIVVETERLMQSSYLMINPYGEFEFRDDENRLHQSRKILEVGVEEALREVHTDYQRFLERGGEYRVSEVRAKG